MCNLYAVTKGQQAIRELSRAMHDRISNLPPLPGIFPDYAAPIVRNTANGRELTIARTISTTGRYRSPPFAAILSVGMLWFRITNHIVSRSSDQPLATIRPTLQRAESQYEYIVNGALIYQE